MPSTPWAIQRTKRKQPSTEPAVRKRVRISDDVARRLSSGSKSRNQQTLTQIQWADSPQTSFEHDADLRAIGLDHSTDDTKTRPTRRATPRDSTLTQMDWLDNKHTQKDDSTDYLAMLPRPDNEGKENMIPQLDGAYSSTHKSRKRKTTGTLNNLTAPFKREGDSDPREQNLTSSSKKIFPTESRNDTSRRRSTRIASKVRPDVEEIPKHRSKTLEPDYKQSAQSVSKNIPGLEYGSPKETVESYTISQNICPPHTPRQRKEVPSSQTPETLVKVRSRVRQNMDVSPSKVQGRTPLREKSSNIQSKTYSEGLKASKLMLGQTDHSPKRTKVCVLKVPNKALLQRPSRTEDMECDIFSLPVTSSSSQTDHRPSTSRTTDARRQNLLREEQSIEIPPTSEPRSSSGNDLPSSPPVAETQGSLPELSDLIPTRVSLPAPVEGPGFEHSHNQASGGDSILVHDFGRVSQNDRPKADRNPVMQRTENIFDNEEMLLDDEVAGFEPSAHIPSAETTVNVHECESELGSPVRNDTQFNINLLQRTSSPTPAASSMVQAKRKGSPSVHGSSTPKRMRQTPSKGIQEEDVDKETSIPTPRLVQKCNTPGKQTTHSNDDARTSDANFPSSDSYETVSTIPLNDAPQPRSSPSMLPPARPATQRSVHPASMPRPSQVSTQAPTQNDFPSSAPAATQGHGEIERILIKDSSSVPPRLSQIPSNVGKSQSQGPNLHFISNSDDEIDDLDLDPASSTLRNRHSARKRYNLPRKDTGSSLKSIRMPIPESSEQRIQTTDDGPSSPSLEPLIPSPHSKDFHQRNDLSAGREQVLESDLTSSPISSPDPSPLKKKYDPIPGFDNDTQSNFTQDGHITAAYIHREREAGRLPDWFTPLPHQIPNFTGRPKDRRKQR